MSARSSIYLSIANTALCENAEQKGSERLENTIGLAMADVLSDFYNLMPGDLDLEDEPEEKNVPPG